MSQRLAILCSGQGTQNPTMYNLIENVPYIEWLKESGIETKLSTIFSDSKLLFANKFAQPLIVSSTLALWERLKDEIVSPTIVAGYSLGEVAAYGVAGALKPFEAVKVSVERAKLMDACGEKNPSQALMAVYFNSLNLEKYQLYVAIDNRPFNVIVGGLLKDLQILKSDCVTRNIKTTMIPIEIASHTPLMQEAVEPFKNYLKTTSFRDPKTPVIAGLNSRFVYNRDLAMEYLSRELAEPLQWGECMDILAEQRIDIALELGPGRALTRILKERHPEINCRAVDDFRSLKGIISWVNRKNKE